MSTTAEPKLYRVLFEAGWSGKDPQVDSELAVLISEDFYDEDPAVKVAVRDQYNLGRVLFYARWSGNDTRVAADTSIVIYVALYGEGRVAARTVKEFEQRTGGDLDVQRFEWVGP
jgi:hypothetical protein